MSKINTIEILDNSAKIIFLNLHIKIDSETINKIEEKGKTILEDLIIRLKNNYS